VIDGQVTYARASHNTYMAALVDYGIPGGLLYLLILWRAARQLMTVVRSSEIGDYSEIRLYGVGLTAGLAVIVVGGLFSNYIKLELLIWILGLGTGLAYLQRTALVSAGRGHRSAEGQATAPYAALSRIKRPEG